MIELKENRNFQKKIFSSFYLLPSDSESEDLSELFRNLSLFTSTIRNDIIVKTIISANDTSNKVPCIPISTVGMPVEKVRVEAATVISSGDTAIASQKLQRFSRKRPIPAIIDVILSMIRIQRSAARPNENINR
jgi:hypothetical protein